MTYEETAKYSTSIGQAEVMAIGDQAAVHIYRETQELGLVEENLADVSSNTFVPPTHGQNLAETLQRQHLLVLYGQNQMGKAALARYLAFLIQKQEIALLKAFRLRQRSELQDLPDLLTQRKNQIILGYDVEPFETVDLLQDIRGSASKQKSFIILTIDVNKTEWSVPEAYTSYFAKVEVDSPYTKQDLQVLLRRRLNKYFRQLKRLGLPPQVLLKELPSPSQITRFADMLSEQTESLDRESLRNFYVATKNTSWAVNKWLHSLTENERYLVIALALFDDLPEQYFWEIYERLVKIWQKRDHTLVALDYYALDAFSSFVTLGPQIAYKEAEYRHVVLEAILHKYRRSLRMILPLLEKLIKDSVVNNFSRGMRISTAQAVGLIGIVEWPVVEGILLNWAAHETVRIRAATSHAYQQMLLTQGQNALIAILNKLDQWLEINTPPNRDKDVPEMFYTRWTVASSLGRLGRIVPKKDFEREVLPRLDNVSKDEHFLVRASAVYALRTLGVSRFSLVRHILIERAADWNAYVRSEVAYTLHILRVSHWADIQRLLYRWFQKDGQERQWTGLQTLLFVGRDDPTIIDKLYTFAAHNQQARARLENTVITMLAPQEQTSNDIYFYLETLIRKDNLADSYLLINPLVHTLDHHYPKAQQLINDWQASAHPDLESVAQIVSQRSSVLRNERQHLRKILLTKYLYDDQKLERFAASLPLDDRRSFWADVEVERIDYEIQQTQKQRQEKERLWEFLLARYLDSEETLQRFVASLTDAERRVFWTEVQRKRSERQQEKERLWEFLLTGPLDDYAKLQEFELTLTPDERKMFWADVEAEQAERQAKQERQVRQKRFRIILIAVFVLILLSPLACCIGSVWTA